MIKVTAKVDETGISVRMEKLSGSVDNILDEVSSIAASVVGNILANGAPQGVRPKEFEKFIVNELVKRTKEGVRQLTEGEVEATTTQGIKHKGIVVPGKENNKGFLN